MFFVNSPTRLACGVLTVKKGYRLGYAERAGPSSPSLGSPGDLGTMILVPGSFVVNLLVNLVESPRTHRESKNPSIIQEPIVNPIHHQE